MNWHTKRLPLGCFESSACVNHSVRRPEPCPIMCHWTPTH